MLPVCPKCDVGLIILNFKETEVDYCLRCRGLWLDAGELEQLMGSTGASTDDPLLKFQNQPGVVATGHKHLCPRCDEPLCEIAAGKSLTLDRCPRGHGLWFDADELGQLLSMFPPENGANRTVDFLNELFGRAPKVKQGETKQ